MNWQYFNTAPCLEFKTCGNRTGHKSGKCPDCRRTKCADPECEIIINGNTRYCSRHQTRRTYHNWQSKNGIELRG